jgi:hypothetical protein
VLFQTESRKEEKEQRDRGGSALHVAAGTEEDRETAESSSVDGKSGMIQISFRSSTRFQTCPTSPTDVRPPLQLPQQLVLRRVKHLPVSEEYWQVALFNPFIQQISPYPIMLPDIFAPVSSCVSCNRWPSPGRREGEAHRFSQSMR